MRRGVSTAVCRRVLRAYRSFESHRSASRTHRISISRGLSLTVVGTLPTLNPCVCLIRYCQRAQYCIQDGDCLLLGGREVPWVAGPRTLTVSDCATHQHHTTRTLRRDFFPSLAGHEGLARARLLLTPPPPTLVARLRLPARVAAWGTGGAASASPCAFSKVL